MNLTKYRAGARSMAGRVSAGFSTFLAAMAVAMATMPMLAMATPADPGAAISAEVTTAKTTVEGILVILAGVVGLFILWSYLKRAK
jgi:hypothetical protein